MEAEEAIAPFLARAPLSPRTEIKDCVEDLPEQVQADARAQDSYEKGGKGASHGGVLYGLRMKITQRSRHRGYSGESDAPVLWLAAGLGSEFLQQTYPAFVLDRTSVSHAVLPEWCMRRRIQLSSSRRSCSMSSTISTPASSSTNAPEKDELELLADDWLKDFPPNRRNAILREARRNRAQLSSIPWYAEQERKTGARLWLNLSISYMGED